MRKKIILLLSFFLAIVLNLKAVVVSSDSVLLATYEPGGPISTTSSWTQGDTSLNFQNPIKDAVNSSNGVLKFVKTTQYSSAVLINNFNGDGESVSIYKYPFIKLKAMSDSTLSKTIKVEIEDINGYQVTVSATMPATLNKWADITFDFTNALTSTPLSLIKDFIIFIDYGNATPLNSRYYIDDIRFDGPTSTY